MIKYFILDDQQIPKEVTQDEHSNWSKDNSIKYNREFIRNDGTKQISLTFKGTQEPNKELSLFSVRSVFKGYDGDIVTDFKHDFSSLQDATEHYEEELLLNGDEE